MKLVQRFPKNLVTVTLLAATTMASGSVLACANDSNGTQKRVQRLTEHLQLDEAQSSKVEGILNAHHATMKASREALKTQLETVLTAEQLQKFESMPRPGKFKQRQL